MNYFSLNNKNHKVNFKEALFNGLAPSLIFLVLDVPSIKSNCSNVSRYTEDLLYEIDILHFHYFRIDYKL